MELQLRSRTIEEIFFKEAIVSEGPQIQNHLTALKNLKLTAIGSFSNDISKPDLSVPFTKTPDSLEIVTGFIKNNYGWILLATAVAVSGYFYFKPCDCQNKIKR